MTDESLDSIAEMPTGAEQANPQADTAGITAADTGAQEATPPAQTPDASTTDTRSETAEQLLARAVVPGAEKHPSVGNRNPADAAPATEQSPFAKLTPEQQRMLQDPAQIQRLANLDKLWGQQSNELGRLRQQIQSYQGLPPADHLRSVLEQQRQAAQLANLKPWQKGNPESPKNLERIKRAEMFRDARNAETLPDGTISPEGQRRLSNLASKWGVQKEDVDLLHNFEEDKSQIQERLATDFDGLFADKFNQQFEMAWQQKQAEQQAQAGAAQFLQGNQEVIAQHPDAVLWAMNNPSRREVGLRLAQLEIENQKLRTGSVQNAEAVSTAKARDAITKTRATQKRDPVTNEDPIATVMDRAGKEKWSSQKLLTELMKARGLQD